MRVVGIDTGINGAVALVSDEPVNDQLIVDIPTMQEGKHREIDYAALRDILFLMRPEFAFVELANARPGRDEKTGEEIAMGGTSIFRFGGAYYAIKAVCACLDIPYKAVPPFVWKKHFGLPGGKASKEASRQLVLRDYPSVARLLTRKLDHQRAEAFLIGAYGSYKRGMIGAPKPVALKTSGAGIEIEDIPA